MKIKITPLILAVALVPAVSGCYEDKGNYTYGEIETISVDFPGQMEAMQGMPIAFSPVVESSVSGVIKPDDPNYEYSCRIQYQYRDEDGVTRYWYDIDPERTQSINHTANLPASNYLVWYKVKNKTTNVERSFQTRYNVRSVTTEGWLVLSKSGADERARLDMIYKGLDGSDVVYADYIADNSIKLYKPKSLAFDPTIYGVKGADGIYVFCENDGYQLQYNTLTMISSSPAKSLFITPGLARDIVCFAPVYNFGYASVFTLCVSKEGDVCVKGNSAGACFEYPINTDVLGNDPTFKVAPAVGTPSGYSYCALFYDVTNKKFKGYANTSTASNNLLYDIPTPSDALFDFNTGLDFVDMTTSAISNGEVFTVLQQPDGHRILYVINPQGYTFAAAFKQDGYYPNISAPDFDSATDYAAHSQYPLFFWCKDNKVYSYNYIAGAVNDQLTVPAGEKISLIKFNRYKVLLLSPAAAQLKDDEEFLGMENELIVASSDGSENGGVLRFYKVSTQGKLELHKEVKGLGQEIVDVVYRERRL